MARPSKASVRPDFAEIKAALKRGVSIEDVRRAHELPWDVVQRLKAKMLRDGELAPDAERNAAAPAPPVLESLEPVSLRTPDDVLRLLELCVAETLALLARAKIDKDIRLQDKLVNTLNVTADKAAKACGLYSDGTIVNIDASTKAVVLSKVAKLSDDELSAGIAAYRAMLDRGDTSAPTAGPSVALARIQSKKTT